MSFRVFSHKYQQKFWQIGSGSAVLDRPAMVEQPAIEEISNDTETFAAILARLEDSLNANGGEILQLLLTESSDESVSDQELAKQRIKTQGTGRESLRRQKSIATLNWGNLGQFMNASTQELLNKLKVLGIIQTIGGDLSAVDYTTGEQTTVVNPSSLGEKGTPTNAESREKIDILDLKTLKNGTRIQISLFDSNTQQSVPVIGIINRIAEKVCLQINGENYSTYTNTAGSDFLTTGNTNLFYKVDPKGNEEPNPAFYRKVDSIQVLESSINSVPLPPPPRSESSALTAQASQNVEQSKNVFKIEGAPNSETVQIQASTGQIIEFPTSFLNIRQYQRALSEVYNLIPTAKRNSNAELFPSSADGTFKIGPNNIQALANNIGGTILTTEAPISTIAETQPTLAASLLLEEEQTLNSPVAATTASPSPQPQSSPIDSIRSTSIPEQKLATPKPAENEFALSDEPEVTLNGTPGVETFAFINQKNQKISVPVSFDNFNQYLIANDKLKGYFKNNEIHIGAKLDRKSGKYIVTEGTEEKIKEIIENPTDDVIDRAPIVPAPQPKSSVAETPIFSSDEPIRLRQQPQIVNSLDKSIAQRVAIFATLDKLTTQVDGLSAKLKQSKNKSETIALLKQIDLILEQQERMLNLATNIRINSSIKPTPEPNLNSSPKNQSNSTLFTQPKPATRTEIPSFLTQNPVAATTASPSPTTPSLESSSPTEPQILSPTPETIKNTKFEQNGQVLFSEIRTAIKPTEPIADHSKTIKQIHTTIDQSRYQEIMNADQIYDQLPASFTTLAENMSNDPELQRQIIPENSNLDKKTRDSYNRGITVMFVLDKMRKMQNDVMETSKTEIYLHDNLTEGLKKPNQIISENFALGLEKLIDPLKSFLIDQLEISLKNSQTEASSATDTNPKAELITQFKSNPKSLTPEQRQEIGGLLQGVLLGGEIQNINSDSGIITDFKKNIVKPSKS